jgi:UDP-N-acetylglucosamine 2-epimerase (non-hydrolysing)
VSSPRPHRFLVVFGTRPEAIKLAPVVHALRRCGGRADVRLCVTGQHRELIDPLLDYFDLQPDDDLEIMREDQTLPELTAALFTRLGAVLHRERPDWVIVQGDTTSAMVAAMSAFYQQIRVAHVEAGLRTGRKDQPFPEEINRVVVARVADVHFAPTPLARRNLLHEGISADAIHVTGNTSIDALHWVLARPDRPPLPINLPDDAQLVFVTLHRRESFGPTLEGMARAIRASARRAGPSVRFLCPVHPNPNVARAFGDIFDDVPTVSLTSPLDYRTTAHVLARCRFVVTDSGGLQEEAPSIGKPVLVLREVTERPEGVEAGTALLVGTDPAQIEASIMRLLTDEDAYRRMATAVSPYGDGHAAERIVNALLSASSPLSAASTRA